MLKDPEARWEEKWTAGLSFVLVGMAFLEPDEGRMNLPLDDLARLSTCNSEAEVVVLGPWYVLGGTEGFSIQQALARDGAFFDMGEAWDLVQQSGIDPWLVNEAFMEEMERQGKRFVHVLDLSDPDKQKALKLALTLPLDEVEGAVRGQLGYVLYRYLEMKWLRQRGYRPVQSGNVIEWINP